MFNNVDFNEFKSVDIYDNVSNTISGAGFTRNGDKNKFILGVFIVIAMAYILGKYPHSLYYDFHCILMGFLIL